MRSATSLRALLSLLVLAVTSAAGAPSSPDWRPDDLRPTSATLATVLTLAKSHAPHFPAEGSERATVRQNDAPAAVEVLWRGGDFRRRSTIGDAVFEEGYRGGTWWRNDGNGFVRVTDAEETERLESMQSRRDTLTEANAHLAGESAASNAYVLQVVYGGAPPAWVYLDKQSGVPIKTLVRVGNRTVTVTFDDVRPAFGGQLPFHRHVSDGIAEHEIDSHIESLTARAVSVNDISVPRARPALVTFPGPRRTVVLPAQFVTNNRIRNGIVVRVNISGRNCDLLLDSGSPLLLLDSGLAQTLHIAAGRGVAVAKQIAIGGGAGQNVVFHTLPFTWNVVGGIEVVGILGYDFFRENVVHVDYEHQRVELIPKETFLIPADAVRLPAQTVEGYALATVFVGDASGSRFLLDTGSSHVVILRRFADAHPTEVKDLGLGAYQEPPRAYRLAMYLNGIFRTRSAEVRSFVLGPANFRNFVLQVETDDTRDSHWPMDGIVGTDFLRFFNVYFDYDRGAVYLQPNSLLRSRGKPAADVRGERGANAKPARRGTMVESVDTADFNWSRR